MQLSLENSNTHGCRKKKFESSGISNFPDHILQALFVTVSVIRTYNVDAIHISQNIAFYYLD